MRKKLVGQKQRSIRSKKFFNLKIKCKYNKIKIKIKYIRNVRKLDFHLYVAIHSYTHPHTGGTALIHRIVDIHFKFWNTRC